MTILAVYRETFDITPRVARLPEGLTLWELAAKMPGLPHDFSGRGVICINGKRVARQAWHLITPKPSFRGIPIEVTFHAPAMGGGEGRGKQVFALVASLALTALTGGILAGKFATAGGLFAKGTISAAFLGAGVSLAGSLLISALSAPPIEQQRAKARANEGAASAQGNVLEPNGAIPRVIGQRKVFPPLACEPLTYFDGPDEVVEAVYCLAGPHLIEDVRIGAADIAGMGVEYELREGWPGDARITLSRRQSRTESVQAELRGHAIDADDGRALDLTSGDLAAALPQSYTLATRDGPDEQLLHLTFGQGLHEQGSGSVRIRVPLRIRIRLAGGGAWINLPELHFQAANIRQMRATIALVWSGAAVSPAAANPEGFVEARRFSPGQTNAPAQPDFVADSYFGATGDAWMDASNLGSTGVARIECDRYTARILLDPAIFPRGRYEVEVTRGAAFKAATYSAAGYTVGGVVWDLFGYQGTPGQIVQSRDGIADSLYLLRSVSIWNDHPVPHDKCALIAVRARNKALEQVSCTAGGYVPDWDGSGWRDWKVTDNPAPHLRDIFAGGLNAKPVPLDLMDNDDLLGWRADCTARGLTCNHLSEDQSVGDAAGIVASCGYARPRMSDKFGVVRDYDRSGEGPVQIFTPRNSAGFSWSRAFPDLPDGFRVNFRDASRDYEPRQLNVARPGHIGPLRVTEQVTYEGLVSASDITIRARYDLQQPQFRGTFYNLDAPAESIVCRRGSLVGVIHDSLTKWMGEGRVVSADFNGAGSVTAITLDAEVPVVNELDMHGIANMHAVADMHAVGQRSGIVLRGPDGPQAARRLTNATGAAHRLELADPMPAHLVGPDDLVGVGRFGSEMLRLIVLEIEPRENLEASLTLVNEGQELFA